MNQSAQRNGFVWLYYILGTQENRRRSSKQMTKRYSSQILIAAFIQSFFKCIKAHRRRLMNVKHCDAKNTNTFPH